MPARTAAVEWSGAGSGEGARERGRKARSKGGRDGRRKVADTLLLPHQPPLFLPSGL